MIKHTDWILKVHCLLLALTSQGRTKYYMNKYIIAQWYKSKAQVSESEKLSLVPSWAIYLLCDIRKPLNSSKCQQAQAINAFQGGCGTHVKTLSAWHRECSKMASWLQNASINCNEYIGTIIGQEQYNCLHFSKEVSAITTISATAGFKKKKSRFCCVFVIFVF